ncbi:MAG: HD domain-containing protein [Clostridiales Family XIII bacterium]|jgi:3'-5' exoribonuclease|nr:HD domain-containing protein [Clostridiales Family XIII bacterium]
MKERFVVNLIPDEEVTDFFLVRDLSVKVGSNGKQYLDLFLADKSGEIRAKKWDVSDAEAESLARIRVGDILKIKGTVTEWNSTRQLRVGKLRVANEQDALDKRDFFKAAPEDPVKMYDYMLKAAAAVTDKDLRAVAERLLTLNKDRLMYWPAASKNHHAEYAGLLWHMKRMLMTAEKLCEVYTGLSRDLLVTGVIMHDMEKLNEMDADEMGVVSEYTFEGVLLGHLVQGAIELDRLCDELGVPDEKRIMLEHMAISHHYEPEYGSPKKPMFPEAEALHYLDMLDAKLFDMEDALTMTQPGEFSERVWTLDNRRIYKRTW